MSDKDDTRQLFLSGDVDDKSVKPIIQRIFDINEEDRVKAKILQKPPIEPINLYVNTNGGGAYAALALIGAIEMSETPVHTCALGKAFSAGLWIVTAGHVRFAHRFSRFLYHEGADWNVGKFESQKRQLEQTERLMQTLDDYLLERTNIPKEKLNSEKEVLSDWYFDAKEALKFGVVDYLITNEEAIRNEEPEQEPEPKPKKKKAKARKKKNDK